MITGQSARFYSNGSHPKPETYMDALCHVKENMSKKFASIVPIVGIVLAIGLFAIATCQYSGNVHWSRVTISLLCASSLPDGAPNPSRGLPIGALLLLCFSMALLFEMISRVAATRGQRSTIQIAGIGSMVYAFLTATPMHNLMVNIAVGFFLVAIVTVAYMLFRKQHYVLAIAGIACIFMKMGSVSLYYTNSYTEAWGVLQKMTFILTTAWLIAVLLTAKPKIGRDTTYQGLDSASLF
jgi:hypothetical protein